MSGRLEPLPQRRRRAVAIFRSLGRRPSDTMLGRFGRKYPPFPILIGTILSARSRDEMTEKVAAKVLALYPTPARLARAPLSALRRILRPIGFYNQKARAIRETSGLLVDRFAGRVPTSFEDLMSLPGVGRKVAGCVRVYAFGLDAIPVDTHVHRISNRLGLVATHAPEATERELMRIIPRRLWRVVNDTLVSYGKTVCRPVGPRCPSCVIARWCRWPGKRPGPIASATGSTPRHPSPAAPTPPGGGAPRTGRARSSTGGLSHGRRGFPALGGPPAWMRRVPPSEPGDSVPTKQGAPTGCPDDDGQATAPPREAVAGFP
ncbi:MAG: DNA lyase [Planctomycetes bacterium]|nr:DNA lyase [Planctomycetota bacterium]